MKYRLSLGDTVRHIKHITHYKIMCLMWRIVTKYSGRDLPRDRRKIMKNTMNISAKIQKALHDNNGFTSRKLTAEQLDNSLDNLHTWNNLMDELRKAAYAVYEYCENNDLKAEDTCVNKDAVYAPLKAILAEVGEVKGYKLHANEALVINIIKYSGKSGTKRSPELQLCMSKLSNRKSELRQYEKLNGVNPESIEALNEQIADLEDEKKKLEDTYGNKVKDPTRVSLNSFKVEVEHRLARAIDGQLIKTNEQLDAEEQARKDAKKADKKSKKSAK